VIRVGKRRGVKIRIDGPDAEGKNTTRLVTISDATVDEVLAVVCRAIDQQGIEDAKARAALAASTTQEKK
jgi:hypothetical protein